MMPIDWSKSTARAKQLETLNLCNPKHMHPASRGSNKLSYGRGSSGPCSGSGDELEDEDDMVAADLDMHSLILTSNSQEQSVSQLSISNCCLFSIFYQNDSPEMTPCGKGLTIPFKIL
jgi:hypothetical protein